MITEILVRQITANDYSSTFILRWNNTGSPAVDFAATELQAYLRRMLGMTLPVLNGRVVNPDRFSGIPGALAVVFTDLAGQHIENGAVAIPESWLVPLAEQLEGAKPDSFAINSVAGQYVVLSGNNGRGTLYAMYEFLEQLGVRFYAPQFDFYDGHAEHIPSLPSLELLDLNIKSEPSFELRRKYVEEGRSHTASNTAQLVDWMAKSRLNILVYPYDMFGGGVIKWDNCREQLIPELEKREMLLEVGEHGYDSFLPPSIYKETHPDWFVEGFNVFNVANEDAVRAYIESVITYLRERSEVDIFDAWPPDVAKWPDSAIERFGSIPNAQAYVTMRLRAVLKQALPGTRVETISYIPATDPPDEEYMYDESVIVDFAPYDRSYAEPISSANHPKNAYYSRLIREWRESGFKGEAAVYEYYRKYSWHSLPVVLPKTIGEDMPYYHSLGVNGVGIYSEPGDWITYELVHLLVTAMSWDVELDAGSYVSAYLRDRYGEAAEHMAAYLDLVEDAGNSLFDRPRGKYEDPYAVAEAYWAYAKCKEPLASARSKAETGSIAAFMIERLELNLDYAIADTAVAHYALMDEPERSEQAKSQAEALKAAHLSEGIFVGPPLVLPNQG